MSKIVLNTVAKHGVVGAELVSPSPSDRYKQLVKESNDRIISEQKNCAITYQKASLYLAKY